MEGGSLPDTVGILESSLHELQRGVAAEAAASAVVLRCVASLICLERQISDSGLLRDSGILLQASLDRASNKSTGPSDEQIIQSATR